MVRNAILGSPFAVRGPWFVAIFRRSYPELHLAGREVEAPKLKALQKLATPQ